ncbi:AsmA family protein [Bradyrhizobium sp. URHD0069]|uniref:AsmA family protein n=1 Tax=Bradyrhizobium sp. URHD0069 TaxID=1380355 RepID=UPI00049707B3|nr:AsmA family protein [Bradyrhizobium sp. URHD0069]
MRALKIAVAAVIVILALLLIVGIPSGFLTSAIEARVERETGYRLTIAGSTKIGVWPSLNVTLRDITLEKPGDRDTSNRVTVGRVEADMTLASVWSGQPHITELKIDRPVLYAPLLRERTRAIGAPTPAGSSADANAGSLAIDRVTVSDGAIVMSHPRDRVENRIEAINADATIGGDRQIKITGGARAGEHPLKFAISATAPAPPVGRQNIPVELTFEAPSALQATLSAKAEVRLNGPIVLINGVSGALGDSAFNGWASVDVASKPLVKLDLDFQRLSLAMSKAPAASGSQESQGSKDSQGSRPWSNASIDVTGLNYVDAQVRISAAELNIGDARFAPVAIDAAIDGGVLKTSFPNLGTYGGQVSGQLTVDASSGNPSYALSSDLTGVRALPLLRSTADFDKIDGKLQAKIAVRSSGLSQRAIMSNLNGTVFANFQDGAIRGLNVAQMIRSLTSGTLSGWQEGREQTTDLTQLSASFRIEKGQATTTDLTLVGPLVRMTGGGTIDLGGKTLAMRVEPQLVMTTEGQGRTSDPLGLGIPVVIDGPWAEPRIYPDIAGVLDNPDAAYARLKEMGKGLFGPGGGFSALGGLGGSAPGAGTPGANGPAGGSGQADQLGELGKTLGNLLQQGFSQGRSVAPNSPTPAAPPAPAQNDPTAQAPQDSEPMNDLLRQLFNR